MALVTWGLLATVTGAPRRRATINLPPLLANIPRAVDSKQPIPRLLPTQSIGSGKPKRWIDRYEKTCLGPEASPEHFRYEEFAGHSATPELGAEAFMLHVANKAAVWGLHKGTCLYTANTLVGLSLAGADDTAHVYGAIRQGLARVNASIHRSYQALDLTITSIAPGPIALSVPQGTIFEVTPKDMPLVAGASVMVHLLPHRSQTVRVQTFSLSLTGAVPHPGATVRITPFVYVAAFLKDFQNESPRSQTILWLHTDLGRTQQLKAARKRFAGSAERGRLAVPLVAATAWLVLASSLWKFAGKDGAPSNICFASVLTTVVAAAHQVWSEPTECFVLTSFALADVIADTWFVAVVLATAFGLFLCVDPSNHYLVKDHAAYAMMIVAAGLARVVTVDPTQPVMLTVALLLLLPLHLPQMVVLMGAVLVLPSGRPARVTAEFQRGLPLARAILYPAFGAPLVAWGLVLCLGDRLAYLEALDAFAANPLTAFPDRIAPDHWAATSAALWTISSVVHVLTWLRIPSPPPPPPRGKEKPQ